MPPPFGLSCQHWHSRFQPLHGLLRSPLPTAAFKLLPTCVLSCLRAACLHFFLHPLPPACNWHWCGPTKQRAMQREALLTGDMAARAQVAREAADESNKVRVPKETKEWQETGWWRCEGPQPELIPGDLTS